MEAVEQETTMTTNQQRGINRRQFLIAGLCVGGAALVGTSIFKLWSSGSVNSTVVFRNPAYNLRRDLEGAMLVCHTPKGEAIAYRVDEPAILFWEQVPTAAAFSRDGTRVAISEILDIIAPKFSAINRAEWQRDAHRFALEALQQGVLLAEGTNVNISYVDINKNV